MRNKFVFENKEYLELETCSQVIFNGDWILVKKLKREGRFYALIKCGFCGKERVIGWYQLQNSKNLRACKNCSMQSKARDRVGKTYGIIKIIDLDHVDRFDKENSTDIRVYYKTQCTLCGAETVRLYNLPQWKQLTKCRHCEDWKRISEVSYINKMFRNYKWSAEERNYSWELTDEQFISLIQQNCFYCGDIPTKRYTRFGRKNGKKLADIAVNGIDRIDSTKGYTFENCVTCCSACNFMKQAFPQQDFLDQVEKIHNYQKNIKGSETISKESTSQANGDGNGECPTG